MRAAPTWVAVWLVVAAPQLGPVPPADHGGATVEPGAQSRPRAVEPLPHLALVRAPGLRQEGPAAPARLLATPARSMAPAATRIDPRSRAPLRAQLRVRHIPRMPAGDPPER